MATFSVTNTNSSGAGSLAAAVDAANQFTDKDTIFFTFTTPGTRVFPIEKPLIFKAPVDIRAENTLGYIAGGAPVVEIQPKAGFTADPGSGKSSGL